MAELADAERRIVELRAFVRLYRELGGPVPADQARGANGERRRRAPSIPSELFEAAMLTVFAETGRPLRRAEILDELAKRGVHAGGPNVLSTKLWRARHLVEILPDGRRWLVGRPVPDAPAQRSGEEGLAP
jgi:hypothetical protein